MNPRRIVLISFLVSVAVWALFSWPLPQHFSDGIPSSAVNVEKGHTRRMVEGDHLQLLYNYWIFSDMLSGETRMWHNLYEFNTGDDEARKYVGADLLPFSLIFTSFYWLGGRALGWNMLGLSCMWAAYLFTWLLLRRLTGRDGLSAFCSLLALTLPYGWTQLLGGSPAGFTTCLVPLFLLGLTLAVQEQQFRGGVIAALALLFAKLNDAHVMYFVLLLTPAWCMLVFFADPKQVWRAPRRWGRLALTLVPFVLVAAYIALIAVGLDEAVSETHVGGERQDAEVSLFAPPIYGLTTWKAKGHDGAVYLGWGLLWACVIASCGCAYHVIRKRRASDWGKVLLFAGSMIGSVVIVCLAIGFNGPAQGVVFRLVREHVPHYDMIRQTAKIYTLLPSFLAIALALGLEPLLRLPKRRLIATALVLGSFWVIHEHEQQVRSTVCLIDDEQAAYEAVATHARNGGEEPRALVIPLWPGDSAWSSLYQHYASLYRIRMANGYLPFVPQDYVDDFSSVFEYFNGGIVTDELLDGLLERGITYLLLHEDAFPEQVSNFAVGMTIRNYLVADRLRLLEQGQNVWAFEILPAGETAGRTKAPDWPLIGSTYNSTFEAENHSAEGLLEERSASSGRYVGLRSPVHTIDLPLWYRCRAPEPVLHVRARGTGSLHLSVSTELGATMSEHAWSSTSWAWRAIPMPASGEQYRTALSAASGTLDIDQLIYGNGVFPDLAAGASLRVPAAGLFHAGYTDLARDVVRLRTDYQSHGNRYGVIYGPNAPVPAGRYAVTVETESDAAAATELGTLFVRWPPDPPPDLIVREGESGQMILTIPPGGSSLSLAFDYSRLADVDVGGFVLTRLADAAP